MATRWSYIMRQGRQHFHALSSPFDSNQTANQTGDECSFTSYFCRILRQVNEQNGSHFARMTSAMNDKWSKRRETLWGVHGSLHAISSIQLPRNKRLWTKECHSTHSIINRQDWQARHSRMSLCIRPRFCPPIFSVCRQFSLLKRSKLIPTCIYDSVSVVTWFRSVVASQ